MMLSDLSRNTATPVNNKDASTSGGLSSAEYYPNFGRQRSSITFTNNNDFNFYDNSGSATVVTDFTAPRPYTPAAWPAAAAAAAHFNNNANVGEQIFNTQRAPYENCAFEAKMPSNLHATSTWTPLMHVDDDHCVRPDTTTHHPHATNSSATLTDFNRKYYYDDLVVNEHGEDSANFNASKSPDELKRRKRESSKKNIIRDFYTPEKQVTNLPDSTTTKPTPPKEPSSLLQRCISLQTTNSKTAGKQRNKKSAAAAAAGSTRRQSLAVPTISTAQVASVVFAAAAAAAAQQQQQQRQPYNPGSYTDGAFQRPNYNNLPPNYEQQHHEYPRNSQYYSNTSCLCPPNITIVAPSVSDSPMVTTEMSNYTAASNNNSQLPGFSSILCKTPAPNIELVRPFAIDKYSHNTTETGMLHLPHHRRHSTIQPPQHKIAGNLSAAHRRFSTAAAFGHGFSEFDGSDEMHHDGVLSKESVANGLAGSQYENVQHFSEAAQNREEDGGWSKCSRKEDEETLHYPSLLISSNRNPYADITQKTPILWHQQTKPPADLEHNEHTNTNAVCPAVHPSIWNCEEVLMWLRQQVAGLLPAGAKVNGISVETNFAGLTGPELFKLSYDEAIARDPVFGHLIYERLRESEMVHNNSQQHQPTLGEYVTDHQNHTHRSNEITFQLMSAPSTRQIGKGTFFPASTAVPENLSQKGEIKNIQQQLPHSNASVSAATLPNLAKLLSGGYERGDYASVQQQQQQQQQQVLHNNNLKPHSDIVPTALSSSNKQHYYFQPVDVIFDDVVVKFEEISTQPTDDVLATEEQQHSCRWTDRSAFGGNVVEFVDNTPSYHHNQYHFNSNNNNNSHGLPDSSDLSCPDDLTRLVLLHDSAAIMFDQRQYNRETTQGGVGVLEELQPMDLSSLGHRNADLQHHISCSSSTATGSQYPEYYTTASFNVVGNRDRKITAGSSSNTRFSVASDILLPLLTSAQQQQQLAQEPVNACCSSNYYRESPGDTTTVAYQRQKSETETAPYFAQHAYSQEHTEWQQASKSSYCALPTDNNHHLLSSHATTLFPILAASLTQSLSYTSTNHHDTFVSSSTSSLLASPTTTMTPGGGGVADQPGCSANDCTIQQQTIAPLSGGRNRSHKNGSGIGVIKPRKTIRGVMREARKDNIHRNASETDIIDLYASTADDEENNNNNNNSNNNSNAWLCGIPNAITGGAPATATRGSHLWEFIRDILLNPKYCPKIVKWENRDEGVFRFVESEAVAKMWGNKKCNPRMTYEKLSRAMRTYYSNKILVPVPKTGRYPKKLVYKFGPNAFGWQSAD